MGGADAIYRGLGGQKAAIFAQAGQFYFDEVE